ncbi:GNAT family N-acetyltransferase [Micromonospora sp. HM5-17]|uniref:GNAT family N-acetyltransferase n=1 Tax=Micromonospora sp. HM5-17 TaxID=2487710 RepID=UPI000F48F824|nr:GNAT family N-acetyltransferase [Micromonospora sp. HM5-17]ROT33947.1 GNAT family N-acetyltransferase [Micromonospora sp. HM5-17]
MLNLTREDGYELSTDPGRLDLDRVHHWLSTDAYWALGRPRDVLLRAIEGSTAYGVYCPGDGAQVAFGRVVTDRATFAWVCDVYVDRAERGRGLARWLVGTACDELAGLGLRRIMLVTRDAHGLYAPLGFHPLPDPGMWMEWTPQQVRPLTGKGSDPMQPLTVAP